MHLLDAEAGSLNLLYGKKKQQNRQPKPQITIDGSRWNLDGIVQPLHWHCHVFSDTPSVPKKAAQAQVKFNLTKKPLPNR
jgi:hypothetical protein